MNVFISTPHVTPSTNQLYANTAKGRRKTERYKTWRQAVAQDLREFTGAIDGPFICTITVDRSKRRSNADIDNRIKGTLDALQECGVITNDSHCESVTARWGEANGGMYVHLVPARTNKEAA